MFSFIEKNYTTKSNFLFSSIYASKILRSLLVPRRKAEIMDKERFLVHYDEKEKSRWHKTFAVNGEAAKRTNIPFTFYERPGVLWLFDFLIKLGIKPYKIYHVKSFVNLLNILPLSKSNPPFTIEFGFSDIFLIKEHRVCVEIQINVFDDNENKLIEQKDLFYAITDNFFSENFLSKNEVSNDNGFWENLKNREREIFENPSIRKKINVSRGMGQKFAQLSGDFNPMHCSETIFKPLRNGKKAFIQGYCSLNIILKILHEELNSEIRNLSVNFKNKVHTEQEVEFVLQDSKFELVDNEGNLLVFGELESEAA